MLGMPRLSGRSERGLTAIFVSLTVEGEGATEADQSAPNGSKAASGNGCGFAVFTPLRQIFPA